MSEPISSENLVYDQNGLLPAIVQDWYTGEVLMQAFMNSEAVDRTLQTGRTWFWSRSRQKLWNKGETSGHFQFVKDIRYDCDIDCLLLLVDQRGPACHTNEHTCFHRAMDGNPLKPAVFEALTRLHGLVDERRRLMPAGSYTASLFEKGRDQILKKVGEEASELIVAAKGGDRDEVVYEAADLFYHVSVLLADAGVELTEVYEELLRRWK
ncbi:MAG: bifunctional phosphoribosyl-AMP cyclohydrolase/phosphoribosyl-ATP diphosphatase HisIE [Gaiellales bacterium]|nr:MAG: bifunctional phosphoribosyl-AMP cyclohydrolase/phosphoribosyl-ATP diphosphatase HisIE [Gaiellales bacterium]